MMPQREAERRWIWNLLTPGGPTLTRDHFHLHPPRSCPSWSSSALSCPCSTTSDWCSGSLERYLDWKGLGDRCRTGLFQGQSLIGLLSQFFQVFFSLHQDPPHPYYLIEMPQIPHVSMEGMLSQGLLLAITSLSQRLDANRSDTCRGKQHCSFILAVHPAPYTEKVYVRRSQKSRGC